MTEPAGRLLVPDLLRGVALVAMLIAHAAPFLVTIPDVARTVTLAINDVASPLFALVMGMSAQLLWQRTPRERRGILLLQQVARAFFLVALGVWLATWGSWVVIVLAFLGVLLAVGAPLLALSTPWLAALTAAVLLISAPLNAWARDVVTPVVGDSAVLHRLADWIILGGHYRLTNLLPFFLLGALLVRHGIRRDWMLILLALLAVPAVAAGPVWTAGTGDPAPVSGSYLDTLRDLGLVAAVYVVVVALASIRAPASRRVIGALLEPLRAVGVVALSLYLLHVALLAFWLQPQFTFLQNDWFAWGIVVLGVPAVGWLWVATIGTGPVEWAMGWLTGRPRPWRISPPWRSEAQRTSSLRA